MRDFTNRLLWISLRDKVTKIQSTITFSIETKITKVKKNVFETIENLTLSRHKILIYEMKSDK